VGLQVHRGLGVVGGQDIVAAAPDDQGVRGPPMGAARTVRSRCAPQRDCGRTGRLPMTAGQPAGLVWLC
jgi:hypothetical protein